MVISIHCSQVQLNNVDMASELKLQGNSPRWLGSLFLNDVLQNYMAHDLEADIMEF